MSNPINLLEFELNNSLEINIPLTFLKSFKSILELYHNPLFLTIDDTHKELGEMIEYLKDTLLNLNDVLEENSGQKVDRTKDLLRYKNLISQLFRIAYGYTIEFNTLSFLIEEAYQLKQFKKEELFDLDYNQFFQECHDFVFKSNKIDKNTKIKEIIKHIPLRMTKDNYFDYITKSIKLIELDYSDESLEYFFSILKQQFIGSSVEGYEDFLPGVASSINDIINKDMFSLTENQLQKLWDETEDIGTNLSNMMHLLSLTFDIYNCLSILMMLENIRMEGFYAKHVAYKDFYLSVHSVLDWSTNPQEREILLETLPELLTQHLEALEKKSQDNYDKIIGFLSKYDNDLDFGSELLGQLENYELILYYMHLDLSDLFSYEKKANSSITENKNLNSYITKLEDFINKNLSVMPNPLRKARMQHFLSILPVAMDEEEFMNYLVSSIRMCSTMERKALLLIKIGDLMDNYGFFDEEHNCNCHHH
ncbi:MAG: hypothetical protein GX308_05285 [Epulopiscium sp.]|nr:hypothetical protein [Candidatus Epulonipiscium sp.]